MFVYSIGFLLRSICARHTTLTLHHNQSHKYPNFKHFNHDQPKLCVSLTYFVCYLCLIVCLLFSGKHAQYKLPSMYTCSVFCGWWLHYGDDVVAFLDALCVCSQCWIFVSISELCSICVLHKNGCHFCVFIILWCKWCRIGFVMFNTGILVRFSSNTDTIYNSNIVQFVFLFLLFENFFFFHFGIYN